MKESSCFISGLFFFTPLHFEVFGIRKEVEFMSDEDLVDEVRYSCFEDDKIDAVLIAFPFVEKLTAGERELLIWYYVLCNIEDGLFITEEGEF